MENILYVIGIIAAIWVIYSEWTSSGSIGSKIIWTILAILFSIITAIVYYFMKKK
jgi:predicted outer membrane lipoprotein